MRFFEFKLDEGEKSSAARYNSELALLYVFARGNDTFDINDIEGSYDSTAIEDFDMFVQQVERFLVPNYSEKIFNAWVAYGQRYYHLVEEKLDSMPTKFRWVGGDNRGPVADVEFVDSPLCSGISVKDKGGITLRNLTPKALGLDVPRGIDVFAFYAEEGFMAMKKNVFTKAMEQAKQQPDVPLVPLKEPYSITYISETNTFKCTGKSEVNATAEEILQQIGTSAKWQRPFGDWFQANWATAKEYAKPMYVGVAKTFEKIIEDTLQDSAALQRALAFEDRAYFYASTKGMYYVPAVSELDDLRLKRIRYGAPDGTSQSFIAEIGRPDSNDATEITIYIRYANGMFEANPTVRVQSIKNPQYISWEQLNPEH